MRATIIGIFCALGLALSAMAQPGPYTIIRAGSGITVVTNVPGQDYSLSGGASTNGGTVTSVGLSATGTGLTVSGSPVTGSGTLGVTSSSELLTNGFNKDVRWTGSSNWFDGVIAVSNVNGAAGSKIDTNGNISASGTVTAANLAGNGSAVTALSASQLTTGTVPSGRFAAGTISESILSLSDVATANSSTSQHGFAPKLDNNGAHYLDGTGAWTTPAGGSGPSAGTNISVSGTAVSLQQKLTNLVSVTMNSGGGNGFTNFDGWFVIVTNSANHSFTIANTNGDMIASNGVVGAYWAHTNGAFFCTSNATIGGQLFVNSGSSTTVSNLLNMGWQTNFGYTVFSNYVAVDKAHAMYLSNATPSRVGFIGADNTATNAGASGAVPLNADGSATTAAQLNTALGGEVLTNGHTHAIALATTFTSAQSNYLGYAVGNYAAPTNLVTAGTANLTNSMSILVTNASFTWGLPINPDATGKDYQPVVTIVSNSSASSITMTLPTGWTYAPNSTNGVNAGGVNQVTWYRVPTIISNVTSVQWR